MTDFVHSGPTFALLAAFTAAGWIMKGLLVETRDRVGRRLADWLFPLGQPVTYRVAKLTLALAGLFAPQMRQLFGLAPAYSVRSSELLAPGFKPRLVQHPLDWGDLEAAAAELEVDQQQGAPVVKPLRFVAPLFLRALKIRLANGSERVTFVAWLLFVRPFVVAVLISVRLLAVALRILLGPGAWLWRQTVSWATKALLRSAIRRLPEDMEEEERNFWIKAIRRDAHVRPRRILTMQCAVDLWIRGYLRLPDRRSAPTSNWRTYMRTGDQIHAEFIRAGDEIQLETLKAHRAAERRHRSRA